MPVEGYANIKSRRSPQGECYHQPRTDPHHPLRYEKLHLMRHIMIRPMGTTIGGHLSKSSMQSRFLVPRRFFSSATGHICRHAAASEMHNDFYNGASVPNRILTEPRIVPNSTIFVAMSSGVDSSTCAALLARKYPGQVHGVYMCNWQATSKCTEAEWNDVQNVGHHLKIPVERINFEKDYWTDVFEPMIDMYGKGLTPNPDVSCNRHIKFGAMIDYLAKRMGTEPWKLATGHYCRVAEVGDSGHFHLMRPKYKQKDQSYYLSTIRPEALSKIIFPLSDFTKPEVREMAKTMHIPTAEKPDSQGLCFVSQDQRQFKKFLAEYLLPSSGNIVTETGKIVGEHQGLWTATIGQRSGVSMPQADPSMKGVWYVSDKHIDKNEIVIVPGKDHPSIYSVGAISNNFSWLGTDVDFTKDIQAQYRSLQECEPVEVKCSGPLDSNQPMTVSVTFSRPRRAVAPGQSLVLYQGDRVVGSGIIDSTIRNLHS